MYMLDKEISLPLPKELDFINAYIKKEQTISSIDCVLKSQSWRFSLRGKQCIKLLSNQN
jgi:hypothetical protein